METWTVRGIVFVIYDVCQVNYGQGWLDYAGIKNGQDLSFAVRLVREGGGFNGHPPALYRIVRGDAVIFEVGGLDGEIRQLLTDCKTYLDDVLVDGGTAALLVERINKLI